MDKLESSADDRRNWKCKIDTQKQIKRLEKCFHFILFYFQFAVCLVPLCIDLRHDINHPGRDIHVLKIAGYAIHYCCVR